MPRNENSLIWEQFVNKQLKESAYQDDDSDALGEDEERQEDGSVKNTKTGETVYTPKSKTEKVEEDNDHDFDQPWRKEPREKLQRDPHFKELQARRQAEYDAKKNPETLGDGAVLDTQNRIKSLIDGITDPKKLDELYTSLNNAKKASEKPDRRPGQHPYPEEDPQRSWQDEGGNPPHLAGHYPQ